MANLRRYSLMITQSQLEVYAELSTDRNPVHVDPVYAAATPFASTIAHAPIPLAMMLAELADTIDDAWLSGMDIELKFVAPARCGDTVRSRVVQMTADPSEIEFEVAVVNQNDEPLVVGRARKVR